MMLGILVVMSAIMSVHAAVSRDGGRIQRRAERLVKAVLEPEMPKAKMAQKLSTFSRNKVS